MARVCQVTGKRPVTGNNVSHAKNRTKRRFLPNLHQHRFWLESEKRFVTLRVSSKGMRIIDKKGIEAVLIAEGLEQCLGLESDSIATAKVAECDGYPRCSYQSSNRCHSLQMAMGESRHRSPCTLSWSMI